MHSGASEFHQNKRQRKGERGARKKETEGAESYSGATFLETLEADSSLRAAVWVPPEQKLGEKESTERKKGEGKNQFLIRKENRRRDRPSTRKPGGRPRGGKRGRPKILLK